MLLYAKPAHVARPDEKNGTALPRGITYRLYTYAPGEARGSRTMT